MGIKRSTGPKTAATAAGGRALTPEQMKTYALDQRHQTHWRPADCWDPALPEPCGHHENGWRTKVDEASPRGEFQAHYIRSSSGRAFTEQREGALTVFTFPAGQRCFREHQVRLDREPFYIVRGGDHRGNPRREHKVHDQAEHWVEDFAEHQDRLHRAQQ